MTPFDRRIRALTYQLLIEGELTLSAASIASRGDLEESEVASALHRLAAQNVLALIPGTDSVWMAHPFSAVETPYRVVVGDSSWYANCAWDSLAILGLMGDGVALGAHLEPRLEWQVVDGKVTPNGLVHMVVPARRFWEDVGHT